MKIYDKEMINWTSKKIIVRIEHKGYWMQRLNKKKLAWQSSLNPLDKVNDGNLCVIFDLFTHWKTNRYQAIYQDFTPNQDCYFVGFSLFYHLSKGLYIFSWAIWCWVYRSHNCLKPNLKRFLFLIEFFWRKAW